MVYKQTIFVLSYLKATPLHCTAFSELLYSLFKQISLEIHYYRIAVWPCSNLASFCRWIRTEYKIRKNWSIEILNRSLFFFFFFSLVVVAKRRTDQFGIRGRKCFYIVCFYEQVRSNGWNRCLGQRYGCILKSVISETSQAKKIVPRLTKRYLPCTRYIKAQTYRTANNTHAFFLTLYEILTNTTD